MWDVDIFEKAVVNVYRSSDPETAVTYGRGARAEAEPPLPGWSFAVDDLFPPAES